MKESIALIKYDFLGITMKNIKIYIAAYAILLFAAIILLPEVILIAVILLPSSILETVLSQGKRYSRRIYGILPIRRCTLVNARYLLSGILILGTLIISTIVLMISKVVGIYNHMTVFNNIVSVIGDYSILLIFLALLMSCLYAATILFSNIAFTGTKAEISTIMILMVCFVISICILLLTHVNGNLVTQLKADTMAQFSFFIFSAIIGQLFMILSYIASRKVLFNKDLSDF